MSVCLRVSLSWAIASHLPQLASPEATSPSAALARTAHLGVTCTAAGADGGSASPPAPPPLAPPGRPCGIGEMSRELQTWGPLGWHAVLLPTKQSPGMCTSEHGGLEASPQCVHGLPKSPGRRPCTLARGAVQRGRYNTAHACRGSTFLTSKDRTSRSPWGSEGPPPTPTSRIPWRLTARENTAFKVLIREQDRVHTPSSRAQEAQTLTPAQGCRRAARCLQLIDSIRVTEDARPPTPPCLTLLPCRGQAEAPPQSCT